tara:strand:- start:7 stop:906 length:900 start_codon:yes stop_codon:yes gene_type:complete
MINKNNLSLGLLLSGNTTAISSVKCLYDIYKISFILTDKNSFDIIKYAKSKKIKIFIGKPDIKYFKNFIHSNNIHKPDIIFSIGYKYLVSSNIFKFSNIKSLNIHGSLLPKYKGRGPLVRSIMNGDKFTGITVHEIDKSCDGGRILLQKKIKVPKHSTGWDMLKEFEKLYPKIVVKSIKLILTKKFKLKNQKKVNIVYGSINEKERTIDWNVDNTSIYNQIRAFSSPFNGTITYLNKKKIFVNKAKIIKTKLDKNIKNGTVLKILKKTLHVKTNFGCISISLMNFNDYKSINLNDVFCS